MMRLSKDEYMLELGTSEKEQNDLKELTFETFINLQIGDTVFFVNDCYYFIKVPYKVVYAKWLPFNEGLYTNSGKKFVYKQITLKREDIKRYADSASHNYRNLYVKSSLFNELLNRENLRKKRSKL